MNITNSRPQRRCTANSQVSLNVPFALPAKTRQRKPSGSVEDIYLNRLWRSQMPKEKPLESILESEQHSIKPTKRVRCLKFDEVSNRTKLRQRRQKAAKNGWKPLSKKHIASLDCQLACKLAEIDSDFLNEDLDNRNDSCLPSANTTFQEYNANVTSATAECMENVTDHATELTARSGHDSYTQQVRVGASSDADGNADIVQTEDKILAESSDTNKNTPNDVLCEKESQVRVVLLKSDSAPSEEQDDCDFIPGNTDITVVMNNSMNNAISPPTEECLPSSVKAKTSEYQQHKNVVLKKCKQGKTKSTKVGIRLILEQQNEYHVPNESDGFSAVDECEECTETAAVQLQGIRQTSVHCTFALLKYCDFDVVLHLILFPYFTLPRFQPVHLTKTWYPEFNLTLPLAGSA